VACTLRDLEKSTLLIELANKYGKCRNPDRGLATLKASVVLSTGITLTVRLVPAEKLLIKFDIGSP
jgi:hypothetical protein